MSSLTESRDTETGNHIQRTKLYTELLVETMATMDEYRDVITKGVVRDITMSAPLHDIGKVGIQDCILQKPGKLTAEVFNAMKLHTKIGADTLTKAASKLGSSSFLDCAIEMARSHHEKWDGSGYPYGLSGSQIPIPARILAVADVYDALRSEHVYKAAMSHEEARKIIVSDAGKSFDPGVVSAFIKNVDKFKEISKKYSG